MAEKKKTQAALIAEIIIYSVFGLMGLWGLTYISLGIAVNFVGYKSAIATANANLGSLGFLGQGLIVLAVSLVVVVATLLIAAKSSDREFEKEQRRALARQNRHRGQSQEEVVIDAE